MMPIKAGDLDKRVTLLKRELSYDAANQPVETFEELATVWASWRRAGSNERLAAGQVGATVTDVFVVRRSPTTEKLDPKDRLRYRGREYDLAEVTELDRDGMLLRGSVLVDRPASVPGRNT